MTDPTLRRFADRLDARTLLVLLALLGIAATSLFLLIE